MANLRQGIEMRKQYLYCDSLESFIVHWTRGLNHELAYEFVWFISNFLISPLHFLKADFEQVWSIDGLLALLKEAK